MSVATESDSRMAEGARLSFRERVAAGVFALLIVVAKFLYLRASPVNSDEAQHLHVAWGWTQGLVQYRDFFDNHTPLFHLLSAPLVAWLGERAEILFWMRLAMVPLYVLALGCVYGLGRALYSRRVALWGTLFGATFPWFFFVASQYRTDVLWMTAWFATALVAFTGRMTRGRAFAAGLLLGVTFAVSMKTVLLAAALLAALAAVVCFLPGAERRKALARLPGSGLAALAGLCVVPLALVGFFAWQHALPAFQQCVFAHNAIPLPQGPDAFLRRWVVFPVMLPVTVWVGWTVFRTAPDRSRAVRRAMVALSAAFYLLFLCCFWPKLTAQDYLPVVPLAALSLAPLFCARRLGGFWVPVAVVAVQLACVAWLHKPGKNELARHEKLVADILRLTGPRDFVMDSKGETVFRRRPFYYVIEDVTRRRLETGSIRDTIAEDMAAHGTCVTLLRRIPGKSLEWVERSYVPVTEKIFVAGCSLPPAAPSLPRRFEVGIAADYLVVSAKGPVQGTVDGVACSGPVALAAGSHTFVGEEGGELAVVWAQAIRRGFSPLPPPTETPLRRAK